MLKSNQSQLLNGLGDPHLSVSAGLVAFLLLDGCENVLQPLQFPGESVREGEREDVRREHTGIVR